MLLNIFFGFLKLKIKCEGGITDDISFGQAKTSAMLTITFSTNSTNHCIQHRHLPAQS